VRSLGRLGRTVCVPDLAAVLERRSVFQRKALRELKTIVVETLAKLPGEDALKALASAASSRDEAVADAARRALVRKSSTAPSTGA
jgi:hypothetical protein